MDYSRFRNRTLGASTPLASSSRFGSRSDLNTTRFQEPGTQRESNKNDKLDSAYFEYLQNRMKERIITTSIQNYEDILQKQINYRQTQILKMKKSLKKKKRMLDNITERNELMEILQRVEKCFKEFESCSKQGVPIERLLTFSNVIGDASKNLHCIGIKKIINREEWSLLLKLMDDCCKFLLNFFKSNRSIKEFELIDQVSDGMRKVLDLQIIIQESCLKSSCLKKEICTHYLQEVADFFKLLSHTSAV
ncbi:hypothetical protein WA026_013416 [Henosepilachna vigintioctopunctata]|uniref:Uncharacterized protein n=1 Tax=Henosepilachna vigintioctopunctata TaxID=420089 RepID=A0AAW1VE30_9CUCU